MSSPDPTLAERLRTLIADISELPDWDGMPPTDIHARNALGDTPLHVAAIRGDIRAVTDLLTAGAEPNVKGEYGFTPLHEAVSQQHPEVVALLLAHGASSVELNDWGNTPTDTARLLNDEVMLAILK